MGGEVLVLGIIAMFTWLIPFFGLPIPIIGLVWGILILRKRPAKKGMPISGVVLSSIGLFLSVSYSVISVISSPGDLFSNNYVPGDGGPIIPSGPVDWTADGKIEMGEYDNSEVFGSSFQVYWKTDSQFIYFGITAPTTGYVSIGFINDLRSGKDMDIIAGFGGPSIEQGMVVDMWSVTQPNAAAAPDADFGGQFSLLEWAALEATLDSADDDEATPFTVIEFRRRFDTGDQYDMPLLKGPNLLIWSYSSIDDVKASPSARGYGIIELD